MKTKIYISGLVSGLDLAVLLTIVFLLCLTQIRRATTARIIVWAYEQASGQIASIAEIPFTDLGETSEIEQIAISKLYGLHITAGTSANTYSPNDKTPLWQWLIFIGKTIMVLQK